MNKSYLKKSIDSIITSFDGQLDSLLTDQSTIDYILELLSDLEITEDEKQETIQGILELHLDPTRSAHQPITTTTPDQSSSQSKLSIQDSVENLLRETQDYLSDPTRLESSSASPSPPLQEASLPPPQTHRLKSDADDDDSKLDQLRRKALIATYGHLPDPEPSSSSSSLLNSNRPTPTTTTKNTTLISSTEFPSKETLDQQLKLLDMRKRQRKKIESKLSGDDLLLRPNLNAALVDHQNRLNKLEASLKSKAKSEIDKSNLIKQRENQLKKKADARAKATKLERRA